jgi:hypothetical protein
MYLINNLPVIDLAGYVNIQALIDQKPYFDYAVVKSSPLVTPARYFRAQFLNQPNLGLQDVLGDYTSATEGELDFLSDLRNHDQLASWLRYNQNLVYGQQSVPIIYPLSWFTKHLKAETVETENTKYFKFLFDWLADEQIFSEYGRVVVFLNEPGVSTPIHQDSSDANRKDEFIWISLGARKKFFVYDTETDIKHYLHSPIGTFDATNYHGADPGEFASWSVRIDGIFSDSFLLKTGLTSHFRG